MDEETRTPDPLIKSQLQSGPEPNIDKKTQPFLTVACFFFDNVSVCSPQVLAQNKHSLESAFTLQAAFADINISKSRSVY